MIAVLKHGKTEKQIVMNMTEMEKCYDEEVFSM